MSTKKISPVYIIICILFFCSCASSVRETGGTAVSVKGEPIKVLFLGHESEHHNSAEFAPMLAPALFEEGIHMFYTEDPQDLNPQNLEKYDGLIFYANHVKITPEQEAALKKFVEGGKAFIPVHSASFMFQNSDWYVDAVGAQFDSHETGTFTADIVKPDHPVMKDLSEFSTWDETYVHHRINPDIEVLMERVEDEHREPWTWVRRQGEGKVFYTAYGHDERTWRNPEFHDLIRNGILWAVEDDTRKQWEKYRSEMPVLTYEDVANIPNYEKKDPAPKYQLPLSPEESKKLIQIPPGFELQLFASEPDIINPISMAWDEKGRLWVIETVDYPNSVRNENGAGDDRIKILEDTNGDGKADKITVFADDLNIPTSMTFAKGGLIVAQAPYFLFLKDTDGDDKADIREVIIDGWGTFDTHAGPSNLHYGIDNQIWGVVGYSGFEGSIAGEERKFNQGVYRFSPDVSSFEFMTNTSNNTWGLGFNETNDVFASTANNTHSVFMGIPNKFYNGVDGMPRAGSKKIDGHYAMHPVTPMVRQVDVFGGFTAAAGHTFYTARSFPKEFWNKIAFVSEPTGHLVHMAKIEKEGAGFVEKDGWNLFASADEWVSPVEVKVGPDGAVWILDWYNFIIQHNPTPTVERGGFEGENGEGNAYVNPLRDKAHGRIWKVVPKNAQPDEPVNLDMNNVGQLVENLSNDNMHWRLTAQRMLVERGKTDALPGLYAMVKNQDDDEIGLNPGALHALWTIHGLKALDGRNREALKVAVGALKHPAAEVRKAAIQVLPKTSSTFQAMHQAEIFQDTNPNTRMEAVLALVDAEPSKEVGEMLYRFSQEKDVREDLWLSKAVYVAASRHKDGFMTAFLQENPDYGKERGQEREVVIREAASFDDSGWEIMELPQLLENAGLEIDGEVWFRKTFTVPRGMAGAEATVELGSIDDGDITWINGVKVGGMEKSWDKVRVYSIPKGTLKAGKNVIAIKVTDNSGAGGFNASANQMFVKSGSEKIPLNGDWKYKVTEVFESQRQDIFEKISFARVFMDTYWNERPEQVASSKPQTKPKVIQIGVIKNEMKFDLDKFVVEAGKPVEIVFKNPDFMQHNLVITQRGQLEIVGAAADKLAASSQGAEMDYVPQIPQVLFSTRILNPQESVTLSFIAPEKLGEYPFVCTFPGHWRIMNGVMIVK